MSAILRFGDKFLVSFIDAFETFLRLSAESRVVGVSIGMPNLSEVAVCLLNLIERGTGSEVERLKIFVETGHALESPNEY